MHRQSGTHWDSVRWLRVGLHGFIGLTAVAAGYGLAARPDGSALGFDTEWLDRSPFDDYLVPGLFLAIVNGSLNLACAYGLWRRLSWATWLSLLAGTILVLWVVIQTAIIGFVHISQIIWFVMFPLVLFLALISPDRGRLLLKT